MKIVLITTGQPSLNPRLVKEADALAAAGYDVTVLYAYWNDWGAKFDKGLIAAKKWKAVCIGGDPQQDKRTYFFSRLVNKLAKIANRQSKGKIMAGLAIARAGYSLMSEAKRHKADLYIGHNLGALPATVEAAKANGKPCGFDAEDFHRFEVSNDKNNPDVYLKARIEDTYLPEVNYLTASSPLIADAYQKLYTAKKPVVVLNVFPRNPLKQQIKLKKESPVKLFWFSQTIGPNRGIEDIINALLLLDKSAFELHLLGYLSAESKSSLIDHTSIDVHVHEPLPPDEILSLASQFDIGLASENSTPLNRDICLTNKLFTYMQAGLAIVASDTSAQLKFMAEYPGIGKIYQKGNARSLADALAFYGDNPEALLEARKASASLADKKLNWETEQEVFLSVVKKALNK